MAAQTAKEIARRGETIYRTRLAGLEETHRGQYALIEVESGDFEIDADEDAAAERLEKRRPGSILYVKLIGYPASEYISLL